MRLSKLLIQDVKFLQQLDIKQRRRNPKDGSDWVWKIVTRKRIIAVKVRYEIENVLTAN